MILYGIRDELYDIITAKLKSMNREFEYVERNGALRKFPGSEYLIIAWHPEDIIDGLNEGINVVNILS